MHSTSPTTAAACATCGATLAGPFCHDCGEKAIDPDHDFSVRHFVEESVEGFTHFDSRLLRTFAALFVNPGHLTAEFIAGRRVRYLKPIPLFLIAALLFYLLMPRTTSFFANVGDLVSGYQNHRYLPNLFQIDVPSLLDGAAARLHRTPEEAWQELVPEAAHLSKTWLALVAPAWGILLWVVLRRRIRWLVPHLVFALHGLAFFVLFDLVGLIVSRAIGFASLGDRYTYFLAAVTAAYCIVAAGRVYRLSRGGAVLVGGFATLLLLFLILVYRQLITIVVLMRG